MGGKKKDRMNLQRIQEKRQPPPAKSNSGSPNTHLEYLPLSPGTRLKQSGH